MKILIAEDDSISCRLLERKLLMWGFQPVIARDGQQAWDVLQAADSPKLAILDWMMPEVDGVELCRRIRRMLFPRLFYTILLTAKTRREDVVEGLKAGADDYVVKPFDPMELLARIRAGIRIITLQENLANHVKELESALAKVKLLEGFLPICCYCKKIRQDGDYWQQLEAYIVEHSNAKFTHGICPECYEKIALPEMQSISPSEVPAEKTVP